MNNKFPKAFQLGQQKYLAALFLFALAFAAATAILGHWKVAAVEAGIVAVLIIYGLVSARRRQKQLLSFIESVTYDTESATNNTLFNFPLPLAVFRLDDSSVMWGNQPFWEMCGKSGPTLDARLSELVPDFSGKWLLEGKTRMPELLEVGGRKYQTHGNMVRSGAEEEGYALLGISYWVDVTNYEAIRSEYLLSRPAAMVVIVDNYEELLKPLSDRQRIEIRGRIDAEVETWCEGRGGLLRRFDRDRYMFLFEKRHLPRIIQDKFSLVDRMHAISSANGIQATVSVGVGTDGDSLEETYSFATLAAEMALSRGGDQAVIKNKFNFEFFGGRGAEVETRTKVKSRIMANSLSHLIRDASKVYVMGHRYADLDAVGSAVGVCSIARTAGKPFRIILGDGPNAAGELITAVETMPEYAHAFLSPQQAMVEADKDTLLVVVDTHRPEQVEDQPLLESCTRLAVIDHHRRAATYIENAVMTLYEPYASSTCELVAELMEELLEREDILPGEADAVLSGIVLDTKNFTLRTGERTFDAAAFLRRSGADPTHVKLLLQQDMQEALDRYEILRRAKIYRGVAVAATQNSQRRVVASQAADELLNIVGVTASVVLYPTEDGGVNISARSIGDVNVQVLLEKLGGGGNRSAAGAQLPDTTLRDAVNRLFAAIDDYLATE